MKMWFEICLEVNEREWGFPDDEEAIEWFFTDVLSTKDFNLLMFSNEAGDTYKTICALNLCLQVLYPMATSVSKSHMLEPEDTYSTARLTCWCHYCYSSGASQDAGGLAEMRLRDTEMCRSTDTSHQIANS